MKTGPFVPKAEAPEGKTFRLPKYVRTKRARGRLYYYFEMSRPEDAPPVLKRLPDISLPHFETECRVAMLERQGLRIPDRERQDRFTVYFVGGDVGAIKIGLARNPHRRIKGLQCGSPIPLKILATVSGGRRLEMAYHRRFAVHRLHGEWFARSPEIQSEIDRLNAPTPRKDHHESD
jgi:hypothetical protein